MTKNKYCLNQECEVLYKINYDESFIRFTPTCRDDSPKYTIVNDKYLSDEPYELNKKLQKLNKKEEELEEKQRKIDADYYPF